MKILIYNKIGKINLNLVNECSVSGDFFGLLSLESCLVFGCLPNDKGVGQSIILRKSDRKVVADDITIMNYIKKYVLCLIYHSHSNE